MIKTDCAACFGTGHGVFLRGTDKTYVNNLSGEFDESELMVDPWVLCPKCHDPGAYIESAGRVVSRTLGDSQ